MATPQPKQACGGILMLLQGVNAVVGHGGEDFVKLDLEVGDVLPDMQTTISQGQHVRGDLGVGVLVSNTGGRSLAIVPRSSLPMQ